jgi:hypothetical protein
MGLFRGKGVSKRALIVGIDAYDDPNIGNLSGAVKDARAMEAVLGQNEDGSPNYDCRILISPGPYAITKGFLRTQWDILFKDFDEEVLFYFAGHGTPTDIGGFLVTQDASDGDPGLSMQELVDRANQCKAREVLLILDCCFSGSLGNQASIQGNVENKAILREGVTILAASRPTQTSAEVGGHGVFTNLVLNALYGGAADVLGNVSAASVYAYAEQALGPWEQRPLYKSHASRLTPIRKCEPEVPLKIVRKLPEIFPDPMATLPLDPSYEWTIDPRNPKHEEIFDCLKFYRNSRMLRTVNKAVDLGDLYHAAKHSTGVRLTGLGRFYWKLAKERRI